MALKTAVRVKFTDAKAAAGYKGCFNGVKDKKSSGGIRYHEIRRGLLKLLPGGMIFQ